MGKIDKILALGWYHNTGLLYCTTWVQLLISFPHTATVWSGGWKYAGGSPRTLIKEVIVKPNGLCTSRRCSLKCVYLLQTFIGPFHEGSQDAIKTGWAAVLLPTKNLTSGRGGGCTHATVMMLCVAAVTTLTWLVALVGTTDCETCPFKSIRLWHNCEPRVCDMLVPFKVASPQREEKKIRHSGGARFTFWTHGKHSLATLCAAIHHRWLWRML